MPPITSFARIEKKYLLTPKQAECLQQQLRQWMHPDEYGTHTVCSIYYDTEDFALVRRSIDGPVYKEKFRTRSYGRAKSDSTVYAEIKKKYKGVVYKRRVAAAPAALNAFLSEGTPLPGQEQIQREIRWFLRANPIQPRVFIACERQAFVGNAEKELRVTFDENLRWRTTELSLDASSEGKPLLETPTVVMEIKFPEAAPLWLAHLLSEAHIQSSTFSKIGICYTRHILPQQFSEVSYHA